MKLETTTNAMVTLDDGSQEIITCSQEHANELSDNLYKAQQKGIGLYFSMCEIVAEIRDSKAYYLLGHNSFKDFAQERFDTGETQAKNMCLIAQSYGSKKQDGSYVIVDKKNLKHYTATQLLYIRGLKEFNGNVIETTAKYGIDSTTRTKDLRALVKAEKDNKEFTPLIDVKKALDEEAKETSDKVEKAEEKVEKAEEKAKNKAKEAKEAKAEAKQAKAEAEAGKDFRKEVLAIISDTNTTDKAKVKAIKELLQITK